MTKNLKNVDHPSEGSKDISDAVAGAAHNAFARSYSDSNEEGEVLTLTDIHARMASQNEDAARRDRTTHGLILPPKRKVQTAGTQDGEWEVRVL